MIPTRGSRNLTDGVSRPKSTAYRVAFFLVVLFVPLSVVFSIVIPLRFLALPVDRWCFVGVCFGNTSYGVAFAGLHFIGETLVSLSGPLMLIDQILLRQSTLTLHRWFGRVYLLGVLATCTGGLLYIFTKGPVPGGIVASTSFALYFTLLLAVALPVYYYARRHNMPQHRRWAARTFALGIGPLLYAVYVAPLFLRSGIESTTTQEATWLGVAVWASWVPNALVAELVIYLVWRDFHISVEEQQQINTLPPPAQEHTPLNIPPRRNPDLDTFIWQHYVD